MKRFIILLLLALTSAAPVWAQQDQQQTVNSALSTIERMKNDAGFKEKFQPKSEKSLLLRTHCQTSGWSLTEQVNQRANQEFCSRFWFVSFFLTP